MKALQITISLIAVLALVGCANVKNEGIDEAIDSLDFPVSGNEGFIDFDQVQDGIYVYKGGQVSISNSELAATFLADIDYDSIAGTVDRRECKPNEELKNLFNSGRLFYMGMGMNLSRFFVVEQGTYTPILDQRFDILADRSKGDECELRVSVYQKDEKLSTISEVFKRELRLENKTFSLKPSDEITLRGAIEQIDSKTLKMHYSVKGKSTKGTGYAIYELYEGVTDRLPLKAEVREMIPESLVVEEEEDVDEEEIVEEETSEEEGDESEEASEDEELNDESEEVESSEEGADEKTEQSEAQPATCKCVTSVGENGEIKCECAQPISGD